MNKICDIMNKKIFTIEPLVGITQAAKIMERYRIGSLPVVDGKKLIGIITSRDIRSSHQNRLVADAMTREVITIDSNNSIWKAKELMEKNKIERLVVVDKQNIVGIVTKTHTLSSISKYIDGLTNLNKAEVLYEKANQLIEAGKEIAVIFLDIDNFSLINKKLGHVYGDKIITKSAIILNKLIKRNTDLLCRYAGDEFAIVTTRPLKDAEDFALKIVNEFNNENWPGKVNVTISAGVAGGRRSGNRNIDENSRSIVKNLINMASLASTKAKKEKKPIVVVDMIELKEMNKSN